MSQLQKDGSPPNTPDKKHTDQVTILVPKHKNKTTTLKGKVQVGERDLPSVTYISDCQTAISQRDYRRTASHDPQPAQAHS
jgi:hypothetical protein